jgi:hypothetical protein
MTGRTRPRPATRAVVVLLALLIAAGLPAGRPRRAEAGPEPASPGACRDTGVEVDLAGSGDVGVVSGHATACSAPRASPPGRAGPGPAGEVLCPPAGAGMPAGLCSVAPCPGAGTSFALRAPPASGQARVAAFACMTLRDLRAGAGISVAEVLRVVRAVRLPGGSIRATPGGRGLANLAAYFRLDGVGARAVDLPLRGSVIHAEFQVAEYRWTFGDGATGAAVATGLPDSPGSAHSYPRHGSFEVRVQVAWSAQAFLDGRRVARVDDLVSGARLTYPVAELRGRLTG